MEVASATYMQSSDYMMLLLLLYGV